MQCVKKHFSKMCWAPYDQQGDLSHLVLWVVSECFTSLHPKHTYSFKLGLTLEQGKSWN